MAEGKKRGGPRGGERGAPARPGAKAASADGVDERSAQLAAPLKRVLQKNVQNLLAEAILKGDLVAGQTAEIDVHEDLFLVRAKPEPVGA